jgi:hypothetical protein
MEYFANVENESYKYNQWVCTINSQDDGSIISTEDLIKFLEENCTEWVCQQEKESRLHWQCYFKTTIRLRKKTLLKKFQKHLDKLPITCCTIGRCIDVEKAKVYCSDTSKRYQNIILVYPMPYSGSDIAFLDDPSNRYPWQEKLMKEIMLPDLSDFNTPDERKIWYITDTLGASGKSKFVKWLYCRYKDVSKLAFGTSTQLRAAICAEGAKRVYIIDMPRTLGSEDSMNTTLSVIEDLKNGFVRSNMYGTSSTLLMEAPHVILFTNQECPIEKLSTDRWVPCRIVIRDLIYNEENI